MRKQSPTRLGPEFDGTASPRATCVAAKLGEIARVLGVEQIEALAQLNDRADDGHLLALQPRPRAPPVERALVPEEVIGPLLLELEDAT